MELIDSASWTNSGYRWGSTATVAPRSPSAMLRVARTAASRGRVKRRANLIATAAAMRRAIAPTNPK